MATTFSPFSALFLDVQARIKEQLPEIRWIDQELGQMEDYEMRPAVAFPCVLLDVGQFTASALSGNIQVMEGEIIIRLCFDAWSQTNSTTPEAEKFVWRPRPKDAEVLLKYWKEALEGGDVQAF